MKSSMTVYSVAVMSTARRLNYSYDEYLRTLELSPTKLEYWAGEILAMAGGTPEHGVLATQIIILVGSKLPRGCRAMSSDVKIRIPESDVSVFPDGSVTCGRLERARDDKEAVLNPGLVVEVTSLSTEAYDRGAKLDQYKRIKSLRAVWIVAHAIKRVTVIERAGKTWRTSERGAGERLTLDSPPLTIDVDAVYSVLDGL